MLNALHFYSSGFKKMILLCLAFPLVFLSNAQENKHITGKVLSVKDNAPIPNASVIVKGTEIGTVTNNEGAFELNVPSGKSTIVISSQGYSSQEINIRNKTNLTVGLEENLQKMDEVVVIGYGQQKKRDVTGSISSVSAKALNEVSVSNPAQALQGRVAGLYATTQGYRPGSDVTIRIRGSRSISAGNDPLFVVDGIPISGGLSDINPHDIESIEVLKDASATAIYGSRGANGVVLITTRRGKMGTPVVSYDAYIGMVRATGRADVMNGEEFAEYKRESRRTSGKYNDANKDSSDKKLFEPVELKSLSLGRYTSYQDSILKTGIQQNHQVGLYGGNETTKYGLSIGYFNDQGVVPIQDFTRSTLRINLDQLLGKRVKLGCSILATSSVRNGYNVNPYSDALAENPLGIPYDSTGRLIFLPTTDGLRSNPLAELVPGANVDRNKRFRLFSSIYGEVELAHGLRYRLNFGPDFIQNRNGRFTGRYTNNRRGGDPTASTAEDFISSYTLENLLTYNKIFAKIHSLNFTGLYSVQNRQQEGTNTSVQGVPVEAMEYYNIGAAPIINGVGSFYEKWTILSYMARVNYIFDNRYLVTLTGRADGSSRFSPKHKWGFFPSVALGWNITNEDFMQHNRIIDNLKLRLSYGETGNTGINPYQTLGGLTRTTYAFDNNSAYGFRPGSIPNPNLKWETTASLNLGLDFSILKNRISGSVEVYRQMTHDLLLNRFLPITGGYNSILENIGSTRNTGYEVTLSTVNIQSPQKDGLNWTMDLNFAHNQEEIVDLYGDKKDDVGNTWFIGHPINVIYDYQKIGIWQTGDKDLANAYGSQKPGQIRVKDQNNDGKVNADDRVILGTPVPRLSGGLTNRISFKGFELSIFVFARFGSTITSDFHDGQWMQLQGRYNNLRVDYWTPNNPTNKYPRPDENSERPIYSSTLRYFDGSFIKIRNISLSYEVQDHLIKRIGVKGLRLNVTAQQPFIFASYVQKEKGLDPEYPTVSTPPTYMLSFGINAKF